MLDLFRFGDQGWGDELAIGTGVTLTLALASLGLGLVLGLLGAGAKMSRFAALRLLAEVYTTAIRGIPELLVIFLVYYGSGFGIQWAARLVGYDQYIEVSSFAAGVVALGLVFGAFATEVFRGAFQAIPRGQFEAAQALGLRRLTVFRRITLPQVWRHALPGLGNLWVSLLKDTSLVSVIALDELVRKTNIAIGFEKRPFTFYMAAALIFCVLTLVSMRLQHHAERRARRGFERI